MNIPPLRSLKTRVTVLTLIIFLISLWSVTYYAQRSLRDDMQQLLSDQQQSTAAFVAKSVNDEMSDRIKALEILAKRITSSMMKDPTRLQAMLEDRRADFSLFNNGIAAAGIDGSVIAEYPPLPGRLGANFAERDYIAGPLKQGKMTIGRPVMSKLMHAPAFVIGMPILDPQGTVIGVLGGVTDLRMPNFLDNITQGHWGRTGVLLLASRQHRVVITASDKLRIMESFPPRGVTPIIDARADGKEDSTVLVDPRGVEVLSAAMSVPVANWFVAVSMPTEEAFAPIRDLERRLALAAAFATLLTGVLTWWVLKRQLAPMTTAAKLLTVLPGPDQQARPLPIARPDEVGQLIAGFNHLVSELGQRDAFLKLVLNNSSAAIFLIDSNGRITQANQRMAEIFGYPVETLTGLEYLKLVPPSQRELRGQQMAARLAGNAQSLDLDLLFSRADGSEFWGHVTSRRFYDVKGEENGLIGTIQDITERKQAESVLKTSEEKYRALIETTSTGYLILDSEGKVIDANSEYVRLAGYSDLREILGRSVLEWTADYEVERNDKAVAQCARDGFIRNLVIDYVDRNGRTTPIEINATVIGEGGPAQILSLCRDITERKVSQANLQLAANVFSHAREGIIITNASGTIIDVNEAFARITGYGRDDALGQNPRMLKSDRQDQAFYEAMWHDLIDQGHWSGEIWNRHKDGEVYAELLTISVVRDASGAAQQYVGLFSDITAIKEHQIQLERIAHFDALTNLPNRVLLADRLQQAMAQAQRRRQQLAVVYLDLDGFKAINDRHGHEAGDQVLITLAQRMKQALREGDSLARLGGDEFVAVLIDLEDQFASRPMLNRLLAACSQSVQAGDLSLQVSASLGVTFYPQPQDIDADQLLRQADQAMYQAKLSGKNRYHFFDAAQDSSIRGRHESVERIRLALDNQEFVLYYQPKVNMGSGQIIGAEALIRWQHPEKGLLAPVVFLPVVEDHPLAVSIGEWVIDTALTQMEIWQAAGLDLGVSVNIGARQLQQSDFVDRLKFILAKHPQVNPASLELEVLETSALEDIAQISQVIEDCAQIGVTFALDDFGTGYSSLTYLKRLRVAMLKVDQSFVRDMLEDPDDLAILQGIIGLAESFKRQVIAEGVETVAHGSLLMQLGCELGQGYGIARPMPAAQMPQWAAEWQPDVVWSELPWLGGVPESMEE